jgi:hypothetical protein
MSALSDTPIRVLGEIPELIMIFMVSSVEERGSCGDELE